MKVREGGRDRVKVRKVREGGREGVEGGNNGTVVTIPLLLTFPTLLTPSLLTGEGAGSSDASAQVRFIRRLYWSHRH